MQEENFRVLRVDDDPNYLNATYRLRYAVYCREKRFLDEGNYPDQAEMDEYDACSMHFAAIDEDGLVKGTLRLVIPPNGDFPLVKHCKLYIDVPFPPNTAEISRLAVSKRFRRPRVDTGHTHFGITQLVFKDIAAKQRSHRQRAKITMSLYETMYRESKRAGIEYWLAAMEQPLVRRLERFGFKWTQIGPEIDYFGPVAPYLGKLKDIEQAVSASRPQLFQKFLGKLIRGDRNRDG